MISFSFFHSQANFNVNGNVNGEKLRENPVVVCASRWASRRFLRGLVGKFCSHVELQR